jgi:hypothetical protein
LNVNEKFTFMIMQRAANKKNAIFSPLNFFRFFREKIAYKGKSHLPYSRNFYNLYYVIWLAVCGASFVYFSSTNDAKQVRTWAEKEKFDSAVRQASEPLGEEKNCCVKINLYEGLLR